MATLGSEFVASRTFVKQTMDLWIALHYSGAPLCKNSYMFGDNKSVVDSSSVPNAKTNKHTTCCLFIKPEKSLHRIMHASIISIEMPIWLTSCQSILHVTRPSQCHVHHCFMVVMLWIHWDQNSVGICLGYCVLQLWNWLQICVLCFRIVLRNKHTCLHQISHLNKDTCNIIVEWGMTENEQFQLSHFVCCSSLHWHVSMSRSHNEMSHDDMSIINFVQPGRQQEREIVL